MRLVRHATALLALVIVALGQGPPAGAGAGGSSLRPGDVVVDGPARVAVPPPGTGRFAHVATAQGPHQELAVLTLADGTVRVVSQGEERAGSAAIASPPACQDGAYSYPLLLSWTWRRTYRWSFQASTTPSEVAVANAETALREAGTNVTTAHNDCGLADRVGATISYAGRTSNSPDVDSSATCLSGDGANVTGFGTLPPGVLGVTCTEFTILGGTAVESDMRLNSTHFDWVVNIGSRCSDKFSVEAVGTHERGHTFSLDHVSEEGHRNLTMSAASNGPCQASESTLGLGDVRGLENRY